MSYKQIPDFVLDLICSKRLSLADVRVYCALLGHVRGNLGVEGRLVWPSRATLEAEAGITKHTQLTDALAHLEALGCIVMTSGGGKSQKGTGRANQYFLPRGRKPGHFAPASNRREKDETAGEDVCNGQFDPNGGKPGQNAPYSQEQAGAKCPGFDPKPGQNAPGKPGQNAPGKPGQNAPTIQMNEPDEMNQGQPSERERRCPHCGSTLEADGWCKTCGWLEA